MIIDLNGKIVLLTGASGGIGTAIAKQLLESGAFVILQYYSNIPELGESDKVVHLKSDLSEQNTVVDLYSKAINVRGKIDVLINNAGIALSAPIEMSGDEWLESWNKTIQVNLTSAAVLSKEIIKHFMTNSGGIIINISSRAAFRGDTEDYLAYAASKGGLMSLTRSIARAYGKHDIFAYDVAPGFTKTKMAEQFIEEYGEEYAKKDIALNQLTEPKDIADIVVFLSSGKAKHATGTSIQVNAGSYVH